MTVRARRGVGAETVGTVRPARTIARPVEIEGIGLHSGERVRVRFRPAAAGSGIVFLREDLPGSPRVPLSLAHLAELPRRTALTAAGVEVHTVEHLLAVLYVLGLWNVEIHVDGDELPGLDGSALGFWEALAGAGREDQEPDMGPVRPREPVAVSSDDGLIVALPHEDGLVIEYTLDYGRDDLPPQHVMFCTTEETFEREIAPARTFIMEDEIDALRAAGLGRGATHQNTLVFGAGGVIDNELRFPDEFARHKILDLLGDLALAGRPASARIVACRSGHRLNVQMARLLADLPPEPGAPWPVERIMEVLPHRYPFLLVDRILEVVPGRRAVGVKNVTINEAFFQGHFPERPVMPGVLQVEAMAQLAGALLLADKERAGHLAYLMTLDRVKFRRPVVPGDRLCLRVEVTRLRSRKGEVKGEALVDGRVAAEAEIRFKLLPR